MNSRIDAKIRIECGRGENMQHERFRVKEGQKR